MFSTVFLDLPPLVHAAGAVTLPGSKSISNRVLLLAAMSEGTTTIHDLLDSDDTRVMLAALRQLGCGVEVQGTTVTITGLGGRAWPAEAIEFFVADIRNFTTESDLLIRSLGQVSAGFFVRPEHPLAGRGEVGLDELTSEAWILREQGSGTRMTFEQAVRHRPGTARWQRVRSRG